MKNEIILTEPTEAYAEQIREYRDEFPQDRMRVTFQPDRIPGMDHLEVFGSVSEWLCFCERMKDRITWSEPGAGSLFLATVFRFP